MVSGPLTSILEKAEVVDPVVSQPMETESLSRSRQPESEPGSELGERNVRPRVGSEMSEGHVNSDEEQPATVTEVGTLPGAATTTTSFERVWVLGDLTASLATLLIHPSGWWGRLLRQVSVC